jgi:hypothetical protein
MKGRARIHFPSTHLSFFKPACKGMAIARTVPDS